MFAKLPQKVPRLWTYGATYLYKQLGGIDTCGPGVHTSWSCLLPHVQQLLLALWLLLNTVNGKTWRHMWHPTPDIFPAFREPWSSHQGTSHQLDSTQKPLAKRGIFAAVRDCWVILFPELWRDSFPCLNWRLRPCLKTGQRHCHSMNIGVVVQEELPLSNPW